MSHGEHYIQGIMKKPFKSSLYTDVPQSSLVIKLSCVSLRAAFVSFIAHVYPHESSV